MAARPAPTVTVLLVHGAFCDPSLWSQVVAQLRDEDVAVVAPANPLQRLSTDATHISEIARAISGPVILTGHGYGGAVIGVAAHHVGNVAALVYVAGYPLDAGETVLEVATPYAGTHLPAALDPSWPADALVLNAAAFPAMFAGDLPIDIAQRLAGNQQAISADCLTEPAPYAAWRDLPSWYLVAADDRCVPPDLQRVLARRAGSHLAETAGSHAVPLSQPTAVVDLLLTAAAVINSQSKGSP